MNGSAAVIKSAQAGRLGGALAPLELRDVEREAERLLADARRQARALLDRAADQTRRQAAAAIVRAYRRGLERGRRDGHEQGRQQAHAEALRESRARLAAETASAATALGDLVRQWEAQHRRWFVEARQDVVALAVAVARRIAPRLPELDPDVAADTAAAALDALGRHHRVSVHLHPDDLDRVRTALTNADSPGLVADAVLWMADPRVERGGARVQSAAGDVEANLSEQVKRIADELLDHWRARVAALDPGAADMPGAHA